jgi:hypothetical protein
LIEDDEAEAHRLSATVDFSYDHRSRLLNGTEEQPDQGYLDITSLTVDLAYRLPAGFSARVRVPVDWKLFHENIVGQDVTISGLGDIELVGGYDFLRRTRWVGTAGLGVALPTGETTKQPIVGAAIPTPLQLGTGTVDPIFVASIAYRPTPPLDVHLAGDGRPVLYANGFNYQAASVFGAAWGADYRLLTARFVPGLDLEWAHTTHAKVDGAEFPNTGRDVIYVAPHVRLRIAGGFSAEAVFRVPVFQDVNATQFGETFQMAFRLSYVSPPLIAGDHEHHHDHDHSIVITER